MPTNTYDWPPSAEDREFMEYLDEFTEDLPGGHSFGLLLYKGDPIAFRIGCDDWLAENEAEKRRRRRPYARQRL